MIDTLVRDLTFALRQLRQTPVVSAVALLSLALGIGANVAIFSLVNALILKSLPVTAPERLAVMGRLDQRTPDGTASTSATHPQFEYLRDHQDFLAGVTAVSFARFNLNAAGEARNVPGLYVDGRLLEVLGVRPVIGRSFNREDDRVGGGPGGPVAIVSHGYWLREHGGDPAILGRTVALDGHAFTIVGVTPQNFHGIRVGFSFDVMIPLGSEPIIRGAESSLGRRTSWWLTIFARFQPGQTRDQAEARMRDLQPQLRAATLPNRAEDQADYFTEPIVFEPAAAGNSSLRVRYSRPLYVLLGIVGLVLTIACVNMANLLLAQSVTRRREIAVRLSLGANRSQIVRQLLVESLMLSVLGAGAGLAVAAWGSRALVALLSTRTSQVALDLSMDWRVFAFTATVGALTGLVFGVVPAVRGTQLSPADVLRDTSRGIVSGGSRLSIGHGLVALQVALSFVLVLGSALFVRTFVDLAGQEMGFKADRVMLATIDLRRTGVAADARLRVFDQVREAIAAVPGVESAAASLVTPVSGSTWMLGARVPDLPAPAGPTTGARFNGVTPGYFRTLGTPLLAGRDFTAADAAGQSGVMIVNEAFSRKYLGVDNPVGRTFFLEGTGGAPERLVEIVGLVHNAKYQSLREAPQPTMYGPLAQQPRISSSARMVIQTTGSPWNAREALVSAVAGVNKDIAIDLKAFDEDLGAALQQERLIASLSAVFGGLALVLAALGLYGVMSYAVSRRRHEIGIRMAVGAEPGVVVRLVLNQVAAITVAGLAAGAIGAAVSGRFITALLFNVQANDLTMLVATAVTLAAAAGLAGYLPARRAARIDPMTALRQD